MFCGPFLLSTFLCFFVVHTFNELKGRSLRGCILLEKPYVVSDKSQRRGYSGIAITYLEKLEDALGFDTTFEFWALSFNDFIDEMSKCDPSSATSSRERCPCDIGIASFTMSSERHKKISFVAPFSNEAHRMVSRKSDLRVDDSNNVWFLFKTFKPNVWIIIGVGVLVHAIGTVFYGPFHSRHGKHSLSTLSSSNANFSQDTASSFMQPSQFQWVVKRFPAACLFAYAHLVGHPFGERTQGTPSFHRSAWLVLGVTFGILLMILYGASLTVLLFESTKTSPFKTLNDFKDCSLHPSRVAINGGGSSHRFWETAVIKHNREKCKWTGKDSVIVKNITEGFNYLERGDADFYYALEGSVITRANRKCEEFQVVGEPFFSTSVAFVMPKKLNNLRDVYNKISAQTRLLREQDGFSSAALIASRNSCGEFVDATVTAGKLTAFFIMYAVGWAVLLLYRIAFLYKRKPKKNQEEHFSPSSSGNIVERTMYDGISRETGENLQRTSGDDYLDDRQTESCHQLQESINAPV